MQLRRFETPAIAHFAYLLADGGVAAIVDPRRDVDEYLDAARSMGVRIAYVIETHRHEDFVMGSTHLAQRTGAKVVNGQHDCFGRGDLRLADGDTFTLGSLTIEALHTPGHTPESMCWVVRTEEAPQEPWGVFTGDTLFYGDTGRSDLPDAERAEQNAGRIHDAVHEKLAPLGDGTLVLPAHGPGSVCGSGMAERSFSTLGGEKSYNPVFTLDRDEFAKQKGAERLPRPPYFRHMEELNLAGGTAPPRRPADVPLLSPNELADRPEDSVLIDVREPEAYAGAHLPGAHAVWLGGLPIFGGWVASHEDAVYLCTGSAETIDPAVEHLMRIGIDDIRGALRDGFSSWRGSGRPLESSGVIFPKELAERRQELTILDVREADEFASGHIEGARNVYVGHLEEALGDLDLDPSRPLVVTCGVGHRAAVGVSILERAGFSDVRNLIGGMSAWFALGLTHVSGD
jgi:hydroxyacylglutathione hydrolase